MVCILATQLTWVFVIGGHCVVFKRLRVKVQCFVVRQRSGVVALVEAALAMVMSGIISDLLRQNFWLLNEMLEV
jgi:hypothetical protein